MARPVRFEHYRYLGDKRTMLVHDTDAATACDAVAELGVSPGFGTVFGPDSVPEARNRGYKPCPRCLRSAETAA
jgi:hypothetical protein